MTKICYVPKEFSAAHTAIIEQADAIIVDYAAQGYTLTIRQLYYQFVARDLVPNTQNSYKRLGSIMVDARLAGLIDWNAIEDRMRKLEAVSHWEDPEAMVDSAAQWYAIDRWEDQPVRPEVWIEKDALAGVIEPICEELDVPYLACRGYVSISEMWRAARRFQRARKGDQRPFIIHLGDHDPSGIDMTRDITDRINETFGTLCDVRRIALNFDQVEEYNPPPNPAKTTDSRFEGYVAEHGEDSWELDALEPAVITALIRDAIESVIDMDAFEEKTAEQERQRETLEAIRDNYDSVVSHLEEQELL